ncbi:MAG: riboflavin synthase [Bacteroidetes bacterium]|nr:MAG: riboflavin synthase [Bacteroidota bacterium]REK03413.1 MAG: riboflavin synthase [Bacteroidota bacterium]REK34475.1 MAG: riboflavin synthase [Bacteroidota bacterium]REK50407.1 MAG: riboflavin synthase [Bacteroidota bacterium]
MFTGIIEQQGIVEKAEMRDGNLLLGIRSSISSELKVDQSVSHNGVCLTVVEIKGDVYFVHAIEETLKRSNIGFLKKGDAVNLERSMKLGDRLDGHIVQGHVDCMAELVQVEEKEGSRILHFAFPSTSENVTVEKGSICVNGVSLTVVNSIKGKFSVAIIPYTLEHTNLGLLKAGDKVNLEFDVIGKYVARLLADRKLI